MTQLRFLLITILLFAGCESLPSYQGGLSSVEAWAYASTLGESYRVQGNSMEPILNENTNIVIQKRWNGLRPNMLATFYLGNRVTTHRVLAVEGDRFQASGDNLNHDDGWIDRSDYLGTVIAIIPHNE